MNARQSQAAKAFDLALEHEGLSVVQKLCLMRREDFPHYQAKLRRQRAFSLGMESFERNPKTGKLQGQMMLFTLEGAA